MSILVQYVNEVLTPSDNQLKFMKSRVKSIKKVLAKNSPITPKEIHLGGSMAKGTMLANKLDADLVFIYNRNEEVGNNWRKHVTAVYKPLQSNFPEVEVEEAINIAIHIKTSFEDQIVNFDIVPCYYINSPKMMENHTGSKLYIPITTIWHTRYLGRYKNLRYFTHVVRLLKDWKKEHEVPLKCLHLELIVADVYDNIIEDIDNINDIDEVLMSCFENVLDTLEGYPVIPSRWKYCNEENYEEQYKSPVIIDPANPSDNLLADLEPADIRKIRMRTKKTIKNLREGYFADIFNRKKSTKFFD
jgi:tRNA nucleotidyltransferase (CCA-adding enzyme)